MLLQLHTTPYNNSDMSFIYCPEIYVNPREVVAIHRESSHFFPVFLAENFVESNLAKVCYKSKPFCTILYTHSENGCIICIASNHRTSRGKDEIYIKNTERKNYNILYGTKIAFLLIFIFLFRIFSQLFSSI